MKITAEELLQRYAAGERDFSGTDLSGINIAVGYAETLIEQYQPEDKSWLDGVLLCDIDLSNANLEFASFDGGELSSANLQEANFRGASLRQVIFYDADLRGVDFSNANLKAAELSEANLEKANFKDANLSGASLCSADLEGINFAGANLYEADFYATTLDGNNFTNTNLAGANLEAASFKRANMAFANLIGAINVHIDDAILNNTIMPDGNIVSNSGNDVEEINISMYKYPRTLYLCDILVNP